MSAPSKSLISFIQPVVPPSEKVRDQSKASFLQLYTGQSEHMTHETPLQTFQQAIRTLPRRKHVEIKSQSSSLQQLWTLQSQFSLLIFFHIFFSFCPVFIFLQHIHLIQTLVSVYFQASCNINHLDSATWCHHFSTHGFANIFLSSLSASQLSWPRSFRINRNH